MATEQQERAVDQERLEGMIDRHGLYRVADMLTQICQDKADHLATNWQDGETARRWQQASVLFDRCHANLCKIQGVNHTSR